MDRQAHIVPTLIRFRSFYRTLKSEEKNELNKTLST